NVDDDALAKRYCGGLPEQTGVSDGVGDPPVRPRGSAVAICGDAGVGVKIGCVCPAHEHRGQRDTREANAEFLQRSAPRDGLSQTFGQFIEFVVHNLHFPWSCSAGCWRENELTSRYV